MTRKLTAVIFDLDETLLTANIDFNAIRKAIGCDKGKDILAHLDTMTDEEQRKKAQDYIRQHELQDAHNAEWIPGAKTMVAKLQEANFPVAIVTRNSSEATQIKLTKNNVNINRVITREHAPPKPDPTALLQLADEWRIAPENIAYVGDYIYDVLAANNANMHACLYLRRGMADYAKKADFTFAHYTELQEYLFGENSIPTASF